MASTPPLPEHDPVPIEVPVDRVATVLAVTHKPCEYTDIRKNGLNPRTRPVQFAVAAKPAVQRMLIPAVAERSMVAKPRLRRGRRDRQLVQ